MILGLDARTGAKKEIARVLKWERLSKMEGKPDKYTLLSEPEFIWSKGLSPDRNYLARRRGSYPRTITLLDLKAVREDVLVDRDAGPIFGWFAGGTKLLYSKNRTGGTDLWTIGIKDGKPVGEPELVWSNLGDVQPLRVTPDGTIYGYYKGSEVLCVMQGLLTGKTAVATSSRANTEIPPDEISGPNHAIRDRKFGLAAMYPTDWTISSAVRLGVGWHSIGFTVPKVPMANPRIIYRSTTPWETPPGGGPNLMDAGPKPTTPAEIDAWLRKAAQVMAEQKSTMKSFPDYKNRPASIVSRIINGHPALSWSADFEKVDKKKWAESNTIILSEKVIAIITFNAPMANVDAVRPAFDEMTETIRLP